MLRLTFTFCLFFFFERTFRGRLSLDNAPFNLVGTFTRDVYAVYRHTKPPGYPLCILVRLLLYGDILGLSLLLFVLHHCFRVTAARAMWFLYTKLSVQQAVPLRAELKAMRCRMKNPPVVVAYQCWQNMKGLLRLSHYIDIYSMPAFIHICPVRNVRTT